MSTFRGSAAANGPFVTSEMALAEARAAFDHAVMMTARTTRVARCVATLALVLLSSAWGADVPIGPCADAAHRALDFWLGDWDVRSEDEIVATSRIERSPLGCAIVESYRQRDGFSGTSLSFYDPLLKRWRQTWVDSRGGVGEFTGDWDADGVRFTGETHRPDGTRIYRRMTLMPERDTVRQTSLASTDGVQWQPHYDFVYVRPKTTRDAR